jgi:hypothetical protein
VAEPTTQLPAPSVLKAPNLLKMTPVRHGVAVAHRRRDTVTSIEELKERQRPATPRNRCRRIVTPKGAGSSPVGHPSTFRIDKPNKRKTKETRYKHQGLLTPLWHHSGEVGEV